MAHNTHWWRITEKTRTCQACGKTARCFKYRGAGVARCGHTLLCPSCYDKLVHHAHKSYITRRQFGQKIFIFILGVFIGAPIGYKLIYHINNLKMIRVTTEREKGILTEWALSKAENVSEKTIRLMVNTACESQFPPLIMAIIGAETGPKFDPGSVSYAGACGPMQVIPGVWVETLVKERIIRSREDLFDPVLGVRSGTYIFCHYLEMAKGNLREATRLYLEGIHVKDPKNAAKYFELIQKYLGEIYLALDREKKRDENKDKEETDGKGKKKDA